MEKIAQFYTLRKDTSTYTQDDVKKEGEEVKNLLISLGYADMAKKRFIYHVNSTKATLGTCEESIKNTIYTITISRNIFEHGTPEMVHECIAHEMCHAVNGCYNHGPEWKYVAARLCNNYKIPKIGRVQHNADYGKAVSTYYIKCNKCGKIWYFKRKPKIAASCDRGTATCRLCGGKKFTHGRPSELEVKL